MGTELAKEEEDNEEEERVKVQQLQWRPRCAQNNFFQNVVLPVIYIYIYLIVELCIMFIIKII